MSHHILLVEDNGMHRAIAHEILAELGYKVTAFDNAYAAIAKIATDPHRFDLILMDWEMPEMNGLDAVKKIRAGQVEKGWPHIPVIAFTSNKRDGDRETCLAAGMDDYMAKEVFMPKWRPTLAGKISKWLDSDNQITENAGETP